MRTIVPGLTAIRTGFTHDRLLTLQFVEEGAGRPWTAEEISDGTIQSLALFAAVFDPRTPLAFIEEPENAVHPWIVRNFIDACRSAQSKQIVLTTHSPALIDYLSPDDILVVWKTDGRTQLAPLTELDPDVREMWSTGKLSTFEIVNSGLLAETVPEGMS
jgi:predicted ATPase